jgi:hypothetical protein
MVSISAESIVEVLKSLFPHLAAARSNVLAKGSGPRVHAASGGRLPGYAGYTGKESSTSPADSGSVLPESRLTFTFLE